jgi:hypothetical protein
MKYVKTRIIDTTTLQQNPPKIGQWVLIDGAIRGQYLGRTKTGAIVVRYQIGKFGDLADTKSNHYLRMFAKVNGSK